jgi:hypothetical protein
MRYEALGAVFEENGFVINDVFGTFASIREYEPHLAPSHREAFNDLRSYYDVNLLACIFAPFYPQYSRNCLWQISPLTKENEVLGQGKFEPLALAPKPWGSSEIWYEMDRNGSANPTAQV